MTDGGGGSIVSSGIFVLITLSPAMRNYSPILHLNFLAMYMLCNIFGCGKYTFTLIGKLVTICLE